MTGVQAILAPLLFQTIKATIAKLPDHNQPTASLILLDQLMEPVQFVVAAHGCESGTGKPTPK